MLCYSGNGTVCIKTGDFPVHKQKMQGFVVGFKSSKIFCLHYVSMQTLDIPQSSSLHNYVAKKGALQTAQSPSLRHLGGVGQGRRAGGGNDGGSGGKGRRSRVLWLAGPAPDPPPPPSPTRPPPRPPPHQLVVVIAGEKFFFALAGRSRGGRAVAERASRRPGAQKRRWRWTP